MTFHWYDGAVPPLSGLAVNVTAVLPQTGLADALIATATGNNGLTVIAIELVATGPLQTPEAFCIWR